MIHTIVENHGGFIQVDSKPGEGTSFRIFFPESGVFREQALVMGIRNFVFKPILI